MPTTAWLAGVDPRMERALEIVPPHWIGDDELTALERRFQPLVFERFADGTLLVSPPTGLRGAIRSGRLTAAVITWANRHGGVAFGATAGFTFPGSAVFAPDAAYVARSRWDALSPAEQERFATLVPDAAFEMLSRSDRVAATRRKVAAYLAAGVALVVLIDPYRRHVYAGRGGEDDDVADLGDVAQVDCSPVMPGFVLDVAALFAD